IANVFACRSQRESAFRLGLWSNRLILWGIAVEVVLALAVVYTPLGNRLFGTAPIPLAAWLFPVPFALGLIALDEVVKAFRRSRAVSPAPAGPARPDPGLPRPSSA
ncbi:MAG TPA: cation-translocating P-type ATPase C-terminal domain-containing protein, partial [Methylomirabilota bacterium]|nr:cation-translocating P-type ATPase C-terminal domain-containing protein [Methylomirabilota bacterium]